MERPQIWKSVVKKSTRFLNQKKSINIYHYRGGLLPHFLFHFLAKKCLSSGKLCFTPLSNPNSIESVSLSFQFIDEYLIRCLTGKLGSRDLEYQTVVDAFMVSHIHFTRMFMQNMVWYRNFLHFLIPLASERYRWKKRRDSLFLFNS